MPRTVTKEILDGYLGKNISEICDKAFHGNALNHCAHFVSHALELQHGMLCGSMQYATRGTGASIRCDELYNALSSRGTWDGAPGVTNGLLLFVTLTSNVAADGQMGNNSKKHVGIVFEGNVYNYGNGEDKVRKEATVDAFKSRLGAVYGGVSRVSLYYAVPA